MSRRGANCSTRTLDTYVGAFSRFQRSTGPDSLAAVPTLVVQHHLTELREQVSAITVHQHYRCLKTFFTWCLDAGLLAEHPMRGLSMKAPKTLPTVPEDDDVRRLLLACPDTFEGRRNKALVALLADSGLRVSEALRLRIEDVVVSL
ncbi:MAG: phage integrase N-terminal SAM-like domain-containing protein [Armatimonadota bacterium]|nr:phage integrase N-terminal SAM-like domain-containing protein [Armatimonadota bacterium]